MKKCRYCGFKNPDNVSECLQCGRDLPVTVAEAKKAFSVLGDLAKGDVGAAGKKVAEGVVQDTVENFRVRYNPIWWLKIKIFRFKQSCITCLVI